MNSIDIKQYNIEDYLALGELVANVVGNQRDFLPSSCSKADISLDRVLRDYYINQADKDLEVYLAAIAPNSEISNVNQDKLKESLILNLKKVSNSLDNIEKKGAYPEVVLVFKPWKDLTDKLIVELNSPNLPTIFLDHLVSEKEYLGKAVNTYRVYLGEGYKGLSSAIDNAHASFYVFKAAHNADDYTVEELKILQDRLVEDLEVVVTSGDYMLNLLGEWVANVSDGGNVNKVLLATNVFLQDINTNSSPSKLPTDLNNLDDALAFGKFFIESKFMTLDLTNLIGVCVNDILLQIGGDQ